MFCLNKIAPWYYEKGGDFQKVADPDDDDVMDEIKAVWNPCFIALLENHSCLRA